ncbi:MAG: hypothetical protein Q8O90_04145 [Elusimicrobiota bacterium]|nr:hypothetical protein [Elusimicrobiota bacterium]
MNDNLPEIDFKEKKEKKGGFLGWLRSKLGGGSGGAIGQAGISPSAMNVGRALGTAKFGASSGGLAGLLAGKLGMIATIAAVAVASGLYIANNAPAPSTGNSAFNSGKTGKDYVPAILRSQAANQGSSLDMFKDTNKGAGLAMEADPNAAKKAPEANSATADGAAVQDQPAPEQGNMGQDMMGKLQGAAGGSLTSSLGGGSSKFSGMGGFGNKFGQGATGAKTGFTSGIGAGFGGMPKFDQRKNKMLAMKSSARPVFSGAKGGKKGTYGAGSFGQAKGLRNTQKTYTGKEVDQMRSTQDKAWEGSTAEGDAGAGGAGLADGGAGVMTSPSLDTGGSSGGGGGGGTIPDPVVPPTTPPVDASPWAGIPTTVLALITASLILSAVASYLVSIGNTPYTFYLKVIGWILAGVALAMAGYAMYLGLTLMTQHGQSAMGGLYMVGGGCAAGAAILAFAGSVANNAMQLAFSAMAAVAVLIGGMLGK